MTDTEPTGTEPEPKSAPEADDDAPDMIVVHNEEYDGEHVTGEGSEDCPCGPTVASPEGDGPELTGEEPTPSGDENPTGREVVEHDGRFYSHDPVDQRWLVLDDDEDSPTHDQWVPSDIDPTVHDPDVDATQDYKADGNLRRGEAMDDMNRAHLQGVVDDALIDFRKRLYEGGVIDADGNLATDADLDFSGPWMNRPKDEEPEDDFPV